MPIILDVPSSVESALASNKVIAGSALSSVERHSKDRAGYKREYQQALNAEANRNAADSVRVDNGRPRTDLDASIGIPITAETFMERLKVLKPDFFIFERSNAIKEKWGLYRKVDKDDPKRCYYPEGKEFICGFHDGLMPEFFLETKEEDRIMNIAGETVTYYGGCKEILRQGYRTILQRLVRSGMINLTAAETLFGPPSYDSAYWALLTGRRSSID
jgi:hypothetical protein